MLDILFRQEVLEYIVVFGIFIVVFGLFWRILLIGASIFFCVGVLANHDYNYTPKIKQEVKIIDEVKEVPNVVKDPRREEYVSDCVRYGFTKQWCQDNWDGKIVEFVDKE